MLTPTFKGPLAGPNPRGVLRAAFGAESHRTLGETGLTLIVGVNRTDGHTQGAGFTC